MIGPRRVPLSLQERQALEPPPKSLRQQLLYAARRGDIGGIRAALTVPKNSRWRNAALIQAAEFGQVEAAHSLLDAGACPNAENGRPLMEASKGGHAGVVALLLKRRARLDLTWPKRGYPCGLWALCHAALTGSAETVLLLLQARVKPVPLALSLAIALDHFEVARCLLRYGAPASPKDVHWSDIKFVNWSRRKRDAFDRFFQGEKSFPSYREGMLQAATKLERAEIARLLIQHGANPNNLIPETRAKLEALLAADAGKPAETEPRPEKI
jgi:ankyrin repeat protein